MKKLVVLIILSLIVGLVGGIYLTNFFKKKRSDSIIEFKEILKVKELHLIKHLYQDLWFLYKKNDNSKAVRAIVKMPVLISSYIDLSKTEIKIEGDSISKIILPVPVINEPVFLTDKMEISKIKGFTLYLGPDLYPEVLTYFKEKMNERTKVIKQLALDNKILEETETAATEYIQSLLSGLKMNNVQILFIKDSLFQNSNEHFEIQNKKNEIADSIAVRPDVMIPVANIK